MPESNNLQINPSKNPQGDEKFDVRVESVDGVSEVVIRHSTWTDGLGWCIQKTVRIPAERIVELQSAITLARHQIARRNPESGEAGPNKILKFPALS